MPFCSYWHSVLILEALEYFIGPTPLIHDLIRVFRRSFWFQEYDESLLGYQKETQQHIQGYANLDLTDEIQTNKILCFPPIKKSYKKIDSVSVNEAVRAMLQSPRPGFSNAHIELAIQVLQYYEQKKPSSCEVRPRFDCRFSLKEKNDHDFYWYRWKFHKMVEPTLVELPVYVQDFISKR